MAVRSLPLCFIILAQTKEDVRAAIGWRKKNEPTRYRASSIGGGTLDTQRLHAIADGVELLMGGLFQKLSRCLAVDGVNHHFARRDIFHGLQPRGNILFSYIGHILALIVLSTKEHCLDNTLPVKGLHAIYDLLHIIGRQRWTIKALYVIGVDRIELEDVVIYLGQSGMDRRAMDESRVAQDRDLGLRTVGVAQTDGFVDDLGKVRITGRFAIAGKVITSGWTPSSCISLSFASSARETASVVGKGVCVRWSAL